LRWLSRIERHSTVARHQAIDTWRRSARETTAAVGDPASAEASNWEETAQARLLVERFRQDHLPQDWQGVFDLRFLQHRNRPHRFLFTSLPVGPSTTYHFGPMAGDPVVRRAWKNHKTT
jgi:hypothetical protein